MAYDDATASVRAPSQCLAQHRREIKQDEALGSINSLPDDILKIILSLIPTRLAIRTSILSKRWRHLWSEIPSLSFPSSYYSLKADSMNKTLACYTARKMMTFHFCTSNFDFLPYIDGWIKFAMSRNVENLSLYIDFKGDERYEIPYFFYVNSSVTQLSVRLLYYDLIPRCSVSWTSLKKLCFRSCKLSDESLSKILSGCPILESLTLSFCDKLRVIDLSKSLRLRLLVISRNSWVPGPTQIVAPHVHCLRLRNSQLPCTLDDISSLTEAKLDICFSSFEDLKTGFLQAMVLKLLEKLQNVEKLTFGENFLKSLSLAERCHVQFPSFKVKALTLETMISDLVVPGIVRVLQNSPELEKLTIHITEHGPAYPYGYISNCAIDRYLESHGFNSAQIWCWEARVFEDIPCGNLESKHVASFIELILKTANTLQKMVVSLEVVLKGNGFEELLQMVPVLTHNNNNVSIVLSSTKPKQRNWDRDWD